MNECPKQESGDNGLNVAFWVAMALGVVARQGVCVTATAGSSFQQKKVCVEQVHRPFPRVLDNGLSPFSQVIINGVPADAWGYGGRTQADRVRSV